MDFALSTWNFLGIQVIPTTRPRAQSLTVTASGSYYNRRNDKTYTSLDSCLVYSPPPKFKKPRAIVKFLGGAFIGAVPELTYSYLKELLAKEGYLVVSVPYNVTFDHEEAAKQVYKRFNTCMDMIVSSGIPHANLKPQDLASLDVYSVGHSNGALLQVLTGSYFTEKIPKANAIISFNNKSAGEAVPSFDQLGPLIQLVEASPLYEIASNASNDVLKGLLDQEAIKSFTKLVGQSLLDEEATKSFTKFVDQLPLVFAEMGQGVTEFRPSPLENRDCFKNSYNVRHTLLVQFNSDAIDETDLLEETLRPRVEAFGGTLEKVLLKGNHLTPCIQDPNWRTGTVYTPADAVAQALKTIPLMETRLLSRTIVDWFGRFEN